MWVVLVAKGRRFGSAGSISLLGEAMERSDGGGVRWRPRERRKIRREREGSEGGFIDDGVGGLELVLLYPPGKRQGRRRPVGGKLMGDGGGGREEEGDGLDLVWLFYRKTHLDGFRKIYKN